MDAVQPLLGPMQPGRLHWPKKWANAALLY